MRHPAVLALALCCAGCAAWRAPSKPLQEVLPTVPYGQVRLTDADGFSIVLVRPAIAGDSIVGTRQGSATRQAVPLAMVSAVEVREPNLVGTLLCVFLAALGVLGFLGGG